MCSSFTSLSSGILIFINCAYVKWGTLVQDIFTYTKIMSLLLVITVGIIKIINGKSSFYRILLGFLGGFVTVNKRKWDCMNKEVALNHIQVAPTQVLFFEKTHSQLTRDLRVFLVLLNLIIFSLCFSYFHRRNKELQ